MEETKSIHEPSADPKTEAIRQSLLKHMEEVDAKEEADGCTESTDCKPEKRAFWLKRMAIATIIRFKLLLRGIKYVAIHTLIRCRIIRPRPAGVMVGFNVATAEISIRACMEDGSEHDVIMSRDGAIELIDQITDAIQAVTIRG